MVASTCEVELAQQTLGGQVAITNNSVNGDVLIQSNVTGIGYPFGGTGFKTGGTYVQDGALTFASTNGAKIDVG